MSEAGGSSVPRPPSWLHRYAKAEWKRIVPELILRGRYTEFSVQLVAAYCQAFARWRESEEGVAKWQKADATKRGEPPQVDRHALNDMRQLAKELGLGHASLARIRKTEKGANRGGAPKDAPNDKLREMRDRLGVHPGGKS